MRTLAAPAARPGSGLRAGAPGPSRCVRSPSWRTAEYPAREGAHPIASRAGAGGASRRRRSRPRSPARDPGRAQPRGRPRGFREPCRPRTSPASRGASRARSPNASWRGCRNRPSIASVAIAGPGFINFSVAAEAFASVVRRILGEGAGFARPAFGEGWRVQVEFVSSNPTGPLHVGHGRGAAYGASVANLLEAAGYDVQREYYVNDAGRQMHILALSVWLRYLERPRAGGPVSLERLSGRVRARDRGGARRGLRRGCRNPHARRSRRRAGRRGTRKPTWTR